MSDPGEASLQGLNQCGCCAGLSAETPVGVTNRPGLNAISYRVGTHTQFKKSMLAALSDTSRSQLQSLRTRANDDFSIAMLDAAATLTDVLSFYQERIANESYLRTATERRSILELSRLIGYELRPGVAASAFLAFTLDEAPGAPRQAPIEIGIRVQSSPGPGEKPQTFETIEAIVAKAEWNTLKPQMSELKIPAFGDTHVYLQGVATNLKVGDAILFVGSERMSDHGSERWEFRHLSAVKADSQGNRTYIEWIKPLGSNLSHPILPPAQPEIYALRQRAALFGFNAPAPKTLSDQTLRHYRLYHPIPDDWPFAIAGQRIDLDTLYPAVLTQSWIVLAAPEYVELYRASKVIEASRHDYTLSGKSTRIALDTNENLLKFENAYRDTMAHVQSDRLWLAETPIDKPIMGAEIPLAIAPVGLVKGQRLAASGRDSATNELISEIVTISDISGATLTVNPGLTHSYARNGFSLNANVAGSTHGESVQDSLGSGNASQVFQTFTLHQDPLTFVSAANSDGADSTLEVRANDLLWHEVPNFYGHGQQEQIYTTRRSDNGTTTIEFGDGVTGARLPSGQLNIRARYRKGIGLAGMVKSGQLSMLLTRPLGVKGVTNPEPATSAQDPEQLADARTNAPLTVLTLDRTVSLQDYEDFARSFAGIVKALATWTWNGHVRGVFVTVAGPGGAPVNSGSATLLNLLAAMQDAGDPFVDLRVKSYLHAYFHFAGTVKVDADFETEKVLAAVEQQLRVQFSFDARAFGQPVMLSEVIAAVQSVPGVIAVDVEKFYRDDSAQPSLEQTILAALPITLPNGDVLPAELLTLLPGPLDNLRTMT